jgi:hypothetical protein
MADRKQHPIFDDHPVEGSRTGAYGKVTLPYRIFDGFGALIGGTIDPISARQLLRDELLYPVLSTDRRALAALWIANFTDSSCGPHAEFQFSLFVADKPRSDVPYHPFGLIKIMFEQPEIQMLVHGVWNNADRAIVYSRDILGLRAESTTAAINVSAGAFKFSFSYRDSLEQHVPLCNGKLKEHRSTPLAAGWEFSKLMGGFSKAMDLQKRSYLRFMAVNPRTDVLPKHVPVALAMANDKTVLREWDAKYDELSLQHPNYVTSDFQPDFVQRFDGARFVYPTPALS